MRTVHFRSSSWHKPWWSTLTSTKCLFQSRALQVGTIPFTRNTYKLWTFTFENFAGPLWALRRTLARHSHGMKFSRLERTSSTFCSQCEDWELVPKLLWFVLETGVSSCLTPHSPLDTKSFALATRQAKAARASKTVLGEQIGHVLSYQGLVH